MVRSLADRTFQLSLPQGFDEYPRAAAENESPHHDHNYLQWVLDGFAQYTFFHVALEVCFNIFRLAFVLDIFIIKFALALSRAIPSCLVSFHDEQV